MDTPINNLRHDIETGEVRFETDRMSGITLCDTLEDLVAALEDALEQARQLGVGTKAREYRFANGKLTPVK